MHINNFPKILGIIPARGGSKGVKRKNVRLLDGKPLISYAIESAKTSKYLTKFFVSTDDQEIASVASDFGAEVLPRPKELAEDKTPMIPVLQHALLESEKKYDTQFDYLIILQPTAPMRTAEDIDQAILQIVDSKSNSLVSLYEVEDCHPARMYRIEEGKLQPIMAEPKGALRQALPAVFHRNGIIYISTRELILSGQIMDDTCTPFIMDASKSVNIDTEQDLEYAEFVFSKLRRERS